MSKFLIVSVTPNSKPIRRLKQLPIFVRLPPDILLLIRIGVVNRRRPRMVERQLQRFGTDTGTIIADGKAAFCGSDTSAILASASALDAFNNAGDDLGFPLGYTNIPPDNELQGKDIANKVFWDTLP